MLPTPRIATCGWLMTGIPNSAPNTPGLVIVKVPPATSSGFSCLLRARPARSATARLKPSRLRSSAFLMTGTINPQSSATAMPPFLPFPSVVSLDERKDVVLRHAACDSRSVQPRDVDVVVLRDLPYERRRSLADSVLGGRGCMRGAGGGFWLDYRRSRRGTFG